MTERNGVRVGQRVRDIDGNALGRVKRLYDWGFLITRGFPILFRSDLVARYDELRGVRDGELAIARSGRDVFDLAQGGLPPSWRIPAPAEFPTAATPSEARGVVEDLAARPIRAAGPAGAPAMHGAAEERGAPLAAAGPDAEREYVATRGQSAHAAPPRQ